MSEKRSRADVEEEAKAAEVGKEDLVSENDYLVLYNGPDAMTPVRAVAGTSIQTGRGEFALGDLAGFPYGRRFFASKVRERDVGPFGLWWRVWIFIFDCERFFL